MVTVLGERGTGKSSLVGDFRESLRRETGAMVLSVNGSGGPAAELCTALERRRPEHPLVVVCEGMHRAGDPALGQVGEMVRTAGSVPLLVVVTARPGFLELRPQWGRWRGGPRRLCWNGASSPEAPGALPMWCRTAASPCMLPIRPRN